MTCRTKRFASEPFETSTVLRWRPKGRPAPSRTDALTVQLLDWIGLEPRSYVETMEAWRTSCPRLTVWEDALSAGLIERLPGGSLADAKVRVTAFGLRSLGIWDDEAGSLSEFDRLPEPA